MPEETELKAKPKGEAKPAAKKTAKKTLDVTNVAEAKEKINDIKVFGNGDLWQLLCKASSENQGWMKSTKAMEIDGGCLVQVSTQTEVGVAEAIEFVPSVIIAKDTQGNPCLKNPHKV